jgi:hypothetical protein
MDRREFVIGVFAATIAVSAALVPTIVKAGQQDEFCAGFEEGYRAIKGNMVILPICPIAPITPIGSTPFREGIKKGMAKASAS